MEFSVLQRRRDNTTTDTSPTSNNDQYTPGTRSVRRIYPSPWKKEREKLNRLEGAYAGYWVAM